MTHGSRRTARERSGLDSAVGLASQGCWLAELAPLLLRLADTTATPLRSHSLAHRVFTPHDLTSHVQVLACGPRELDSPKFRGLLGRRNHSMAGRFATTIDWCSCCRILSMHITNRVAPWWMAPPRTTALQLGRGSLPGRRLVVLIRIINRVHEFSSLVPTAK